MVQLNFFLRGSVSVCACVWHHQHVCILLHVSVALYLWGFTCVWCYIFAWHVCGICHCMSVWGVIYLCGMTCECGVFVWHYICVHVALQCVQCFCAMLCIHVKFCFCVALHVCVVLCM